MSAYFFVFGARARPGHAGARPGRAERGLLRGPRRRHLRRDLLPLHRRLVRRRHLRHDLRQPASATSSPTPSPGSQLPPGVEPSDALEADPRAIAALPPALRPRSSHAYASSITDVFLYAAPVVLVAFVLAWFLQGGPAARLGHRARRHRDARLQPGRALLARRGLPGAVRARHPRGPPRDLREDHRTGRATTCCPPRAGCCCASAGTARSSPRVLAERSTVPLTVITEAARQVEERGLARREGLRPGPHRRRAARPPTARRGPRGVAGRAARRLVGAGPADRPGRTGRGADVTATGLERGAGGRTPNPLG